MRFRFSWMAGVSLALLTSALSPLRALAETAYVFTSESKVSYRVIHPMHKVEGVSNQLLGTIKTNDQEMTDLVYPLRFGVPLASFNSGNRNRDRNMLTITRAAQYPQAIVTINAVNWTSRLLSTNPKLAKGVASGTVTLNGMTKPIFQIPVSGSLSGDRLTINASLSIQLSAFEIERPSLLSITIDDLVEIEVAGVAKVKK